MDGIENNDMILPDDFSEGTPAEENTGENITNDENLETDGIQPEEGIEGEEGTPTETPQEPFLKVKYNKEEVELTQEQVIELAQKGMNYDKIYQKYNEVANNPTLEYFNDLAQRNGMDLEGLVSYYQQQEEQSELEYLQREKGLTEELAKEVMENRKFRQQLDNERKSQKEEVQRQENFRKQQESFMNKYPNVTPDKIPQSVWDEWKQSGGNDLVSAYMNYENAQLKQELAILKQNGKNKASAPIRAGVSVNGSKGVEVEDAFLQGFNSI